MIAEITPEPITLEPLIAHVECPEAGAVVTFAGNVRDHSRGRRVEYLEYDAYVPMAERKLREIAEEAERRWECRVAAAHRTAAFDACRYVIDTLKTTVPIWKKEVWEGGEVWIEGEGEAPVARTA